MKKIISLISVALCSLGMSSCSFQSNSKSTSSNSEVERYMQRYYVNADYNSVSNTFSLDAGQFTIPDEMDLYSKQKNKKLSNCIVGDYLEVYYDIAGTSVNEIVVDEANILCIKLSKLSIPGAQFHEIDLIPENNLGIYIRHETVFYVMNSDGTISKKEELIDGTTLYGIYREEDITTSDTGDNSVYYLVGLYSYLPRIE